MHGASIILPSQLEIGDEVKVTSNDGSFTGTLVEATPEEGLTFRHTISELTTIIDLNDLGDYDFYPRGDTIKRLSIQKEKDYPLSYFIVGDTLSFIKQGKAPISVSVEGIVNGLHKLLKDDGSVLFLNANSDYVKNNNQFYPEGETKKRLFGELRVELTDNEIEFYKLFEELNNLGEEEFQKAILIRQKMESRATTPDMMEALKFATDQRHQKATEYYIGLDKASIGIGLGPAGH